MKSAKIIKIGNTACIKTSDGKRCAVCGIKGYGILFYNNSKSLGSTFIHIECLKEFFISRCVYDKNFGYGPIKGICPICGKRVYAKNYHWNDFHIHRECMTELLSKDLKASDEIQAVGLTELV